jgi:hypothetical protein
VDDVTISCSLDLSHSLWDNQTVRTARQVSPGPNLQACEISQRFTRSRGSDALQANTEKQHGKPTRKSSMEKIDQIKQLVSEINCLHLAFSKEYFETGKIAKINLSRTIAHVPALHIYRYRLTLHESINDYLMMADISIKYFYRVKTRESIDDKIMRFSGREDQYPVNNWLNDIFGARIILTADDIKSVTDLLDDWQDELNLKNWYFRDKEGYRGLHMYFKNRSNFHFPWELQIWDVADMQGNIQNHEKFKRNFL